MTNLGLREHRREAGEVAAEGPPLVAHYHYYYYYYYYICYY